MQLRLELAESPAPAVALWALVGESQRQRAVTLLAALIAQTIAGEAVDGEPTIGGWGEGARGGEARGPTDGFLD